MWKLIELTILTVIITLAWRVAISKEMIFEKAGEYFERKVNEGYKVFDLFQCPWCANTFFVFPAHGFAFALGILPWVFTWQFIIRIPLVIMASCCISGFLWSFYLSMNAEREKNEVKTEYYKKMIYESEINREEK